MHSQAELAVNRSHEISRPMPRYTRTIHCRSCWNLLIFFFHISVFRYSCVPFTASRRQLSASISGFCPLFSPISCVYCWKWLMSGCITEDRQNGIRSPALLFRRPDAQWLWTDRLRTVLIDWQRQTVSQWELSWWVQKLEKGIEGAWRRAQ